MDSLLRKLTQNSLFHTVNHWTMRTMAKVAGIVMSTVRMVWPMHGLVLRRKLTQWQLRYGVIWSVGELRDVIGRLINEYGATQAKPAAGLLTQHYPLPPRAVSSICWDQSDSPVVYNHTQL